MNRSVMLVVLQRGMMIKDSGFTKCVGDETPLILAVKVPFRVQSKK